MGTLSLGINGGHFIIYSFNCNYTLIFFRPEGDRCWGYNLHDSSISISKITIHKLESK